MTVTRKWSLLAAVLIVAIFAAGGSCWSPRSGARRPTSRPRLRRQEAANAGLQQQIEMLKAQQADLPTAAGAARGRCGRRSRTTRRCPTLIRNLTAAGRQGRREHRLDGAAVRRVAAGPGHRRRGTDDADDRHDAGTAASGLEDATATPEHAAAPHLDALPGAADAQRDRQLLRAGAVRQQARGPAALVPGDRLHARPSTAAEDAHRAT